ncbi:MAG: Rne/Rng family ribonuclease [Pseudomonadota bacterium]
MAKKMLIDATHAEETRVVVVDGNKVEEFDFEAEAKRQLAGNIYLAKVTRVEPSLQAAFVDYGGNRHGFLAFSEIHPDYYQIPVADREKLLAEEEAYAKVMAEEDARREEREKSKSSRSAKAAKSDGDAVATSDVIDVDEPDTGLVDVPENGSPASGENKDLSETEGQPSAEDTPAPEPAEDGAAPESADAAPETEAANADEGVETSDQTTVAAAHDDDDKSDEPAEDHASRAISDTGEDRDEFRPRKPRPRRYKIQEVIKVRQILLVQVVKEERGNKGAALTTYLSLAGRYCVLMPNTARGGGISRKITSAADRKKLKDIAGDIEVPQGAGLIIRTAGAKRTKTEIKRDYEYLLRQWEQIRDLTLKSIAPAKIYEEGDLIKRSIRDLYNRDIDEVFVDGSAGYRIAKDYMKMLMPSHATRVKLYDEPMPLFSRYQVDGYLDAMFNPTVQLKSGGYIVIGVTEALVAIDVNSGKATKEGSIEDTALRTNLEAADEVARQVKLRDLAGLIVIDFIDMEERRNNSAVEKRLKDKLKSDRARIQTGRISGFGLLEMSRQRLRPGMLEATTQPCPYCHGTGLVRSDESQALSILRSLEDEGVRKRSREVLVTVPVGIANYLLNEKREHIARIEGRYGMVIRIEGDPSLISPDHKMERFKTTTRKLPRQDVAAITVDSIEPDALPDLPEPELDNDDDADSQTAAPEPSGDDQPTKKKRRRRRRRGGSKPAGEGGDGGLGGDASPVDAKSEANVEDVAEEPADQAKAHAAEGADADVSANADDAPAPKKGRSRSTSRSRSKKPSAPAQELTGETAVMEPAEAVASAGPESAPETAATEATVADLSPEHAQDTAPAPAPVPEDAADAQNDDQPDALEAAPEQAQDPTPDLAPTPEKPDEPVAEATAEPESDEAAKPKRTGWWSRALGG